MITGFISDWQVVDARREKWAELVRAFMLSMRVYDGGVPQSVRDKLANQLKLMKENQLSEKQAVSNCKQPTVRPELKNCKLPMVSPD